MASGGYRPNSGPKKGAKYRPRAAKEEKKPTKPKKASSPDVPSDIQAEADAANLSPLDYMLQVMRSEKAEPDRRDRMAIAAAPFCHSRKGEGKGKKDEQEEKAKNAGSGKFAPGKSPVRLVK